MKKIILVLMVALVLAGCSPTPTATPEPTLEPTPTEVTELICSRENIRNADSALEEIFNNTVGPTSGTTPIDEVNRLYEEMYSQIDALLIPDCFSDAKTLFILQQETMYKILTGDDESSTAGMDLLDYMSKYDAEIERLLGCAPNCN